MERFDSRVRVESSSVSNKDFLKQFDRNRTVLISHHGNALPEGSFLGFPTIGSSVAPWGRNYDFCVTWSNREQYSKILRNIAEFAVKIEGLSRSLQEYISHFYMNEPLVQSSTNEIQRIRQRFSKGKPPSEFSRDAPTRGEFSVHTYEAMKNDYSHRIRLI